MKTKNVAQIGLISAFIAVLGLLPPIPVPVVPVPITLQSAGAMLAGTILGRKWGFFSILVFLLIVLTGMPLLSGGRGGIQVFLAPSGGFLIGWAVGAYFVGLVMEMFKRKNFFPLLIANIIGGILIVYLVGSIQLSLYTHIPYQKVLISNLVFLPGDMIKALLAALVGVKVLNRNNLKNNGEE